MHRSLTVPQTQRRPMSPPGNFQGETTKLSVEKTSRSLPFSTAPSPRAFSAGLENAGRRMDSISSAVFCPPLP